MIAHFTTVCSACGHTAPIREFVTASSAGGCETCSYEIVLVECPNPKCKADDGENY